jgi:hypothetical protein
MSVPPLPTQLTSQTFADFVGSSVTSSNGNLIQDTINTLLAELNITLNAFNSAVAFIQNEISNLIDGAFDYVENILRGDNSINQPTSIVSARKTVPSVVAKGFEIAIALYALSEIENSIPTVNGNTLLNLAVFVQELYAVNKAVDAFTANAVGASLSEPLRQYYNDLFRPKNWDIGTAINAFHQGIIKQDVLIAVLAFEGYSDDKIENIIASSYQPISPNLLARIARTLPIAPNLIKDAISKNAIDPEFADTLFNAVTLDGVVTQLDAFINDAISIYSAGLANDIDFNTWLTYSLVQGNERTVVRNVGGIKQFRTFLSQKIEILKLAFEQGFIDSATLSQYLSNLNLPEQMVNNLVTLELLKVGVNPTELLLFPSIVTFMPEGIAFSLSIT